jgi:hypothetical protein
MQKVCNVLVSSLFSVTIRNRVQLKSREWFHVTVSRRFWNFAHSCVTLFSDVPCVSESRWCRQLEDKKNGGCNICDRLYCTVSQSGNDWEGLFGDWWGLIQRPYVILHYDHSAVRSASFASRSWLQNTSNCCQTLAVGRGTEGVRLGLRFLRFNLKAEGETRKL